MTTSTKNLRQTFSLRRVISGLWRKLSGDKQQPQQSLPLNEHLRKDIGWQEKPPHRHDYRDYL
ncbi:hypothetical protein [Vibrio sp. ABG19]|uniref:hypothetical protein n=1 Tax=Vibrio sp. ABG19 TaxID=2817385 RepID=UPI00249E93CB|nr:hypothetical protein [Vibrio sp. ABG19]WGY46135.1 hypothetical protein J0X00_14995 [Vibrio sp. ABG19]